MGFPYGHRKTTTLAAGPRKTGMFAPRALDGPINGDWFGPSFLTMLLFERIAAVRGAQLQGKELFEPGCRVIGNAAKDIRKPCMRIGVVEFRGLDQGVDDGGALATTVLVGRAYDIGALEELPPRMCEVIGDRVAALVIELAISAIGIGLQNAGRCRRMGLRVLAAPVAQADERGSWRIRSGERATIATLTYKWVASALPYPGMERWYHRRASAWRPVYGL